VSHSIERVGDRTWTISELAAEFAITLRTIRFYEDEGLLTPERVGTTRVFRDRDRVRLQLILRGRRLGFTLAEIAHILGLYDETPGERGQLEFLLADIGRRRAVLLDKRRDLDDALADLADLEARCRADLRTLLESTSNGGPLDSEPPQLLERE
jgi:DNA-binding transcriptional MerR regulator